MTSLLLCGMLFRRSMSETSPVQTVSAGARPGPLASTPPGSSYGQIFKSTAFTGGASFINILLGVVRTKVMAVLLGPSGVGLMGLYMTITGLASTLVGMGVGSSGVHCSSTDLHAAPP